MSEMSDLPEGDALTFESGIKIVDEGYVKKIIQYLKTRVLERSHANYIKCYS